MKAIKKSLLTALLIASAGQGLAVPKVVSSIYPLQQIANAVVGEPTGLVADSYLSPHDYTIKPNDAKEVLDADLFIWVNEMIIPQLTPYIERRNAAHKVTITAGKIAGMDLIMLGQAQGEHSHGEPNHTGHMHGADDSKMAYDPHVWLSTHNAKVIATEMAKKLSQLDAEHAALYEKNLRHFITELDKTKQAINQSLKVNPPKPFFIFHDAYQYFEKEFGVKHVDVIRAHSGQAPLTRHLVELEKTMGKAADACLFKEPQFKSPLVRQLTANSKVTISVLDPLGYQKEENRIADGYTKILLNLAKQLERCGK